MYGLTIPSRKSGGPKRATELASDPALKPSESAEPIMNPLVSGIESTKTPARNMTQKRAPWLVFLSARAPPNQYPSARETRATVMREVQMKRLTPKGGPMILEPRSPIPSPTAPQTPPRKTRNV